MCHQRARAAFLTVNVFLLLSACGGGGGGGSQPPAAPTVTLTGNPTTVIAGQGAALTWSSTNATSCTASGGWSGARPTSGSEQLSALTSTATFTLTCTGAGGSGAQSVTINVTHPAPTVTLTASPIAVTPGQATTLTWSSANATSCTASEGWTGPRSTSGTEQIASVAATTTFALTCTGPGGSGDESIAVTVVEPGSGNVLVNGRITFDRAPFDATPESGLNPAATVESPAREVVVEALDAGTNAILTATTTDANGSYALVAPANRNILIRAKAQMQKADGAPNWNFSVRNNTNGDALYVLDGAVFDSGATGSTRNLRAALGWNGSTYTNRSAGPFAILDTVYQAKALILTANPTISFPALDLFWSVNNRPAGPLCPDQGNIGTSFYIGAGANDQCVIPQPLPAGIYILGDFANGSGDTDEFDQHVVAHEFGHYYEDRFSRSDSIGGAHGGNDRLDPRVAFGEGWGNAYSAMTLNDPVYRDSFDGVTSDFSFNLEGDSTAEGWFSESSVGEILYDVFDAAADGADAVALGFGPIHAVMIGPQTSTDALTSIFSFAAPLRAANPGSSAAISNLLVAEQISGTSDEFGHAETNTGNVQGVIPIFETASFSAPMQFCSRRDAGTEDANKLGNRKFFRINVPSGGGSVNIAVSGTAVSGGSAATDPDIYLYRRGALIDVANGSQPGQESLSRTLPGGAHIVEIYDFDIDGSPTNRCMSVSFTGL